MIVAVNSVLIYEIHFLKTWHSSCFTCKDNPANFSFSRSIAAKYNGKRNFRTSFLNLAPLALLAKGER